MTIPVLIPNEIDRNGDIINEDEIIKTAHEFMINLANKKVNVDHQDWTDIQEVYFVESFIAPNDIYIDDDSFIPKWSRLVAIKFDDETFQKILDWLYIWVSMEGTWYAKTI